MRFLRRIISKGWRQRSYLDYWPLKPTIYCLLKCPIMVHLESLCLHVTEKTNKIFSRNMQTIRGVFVFLCLCVFLLLSHGFCSAFILKRHFVTISVLLANILWSIIFGFFYAINMQSVNKTRASNITAELFSVKILFQKREYNINSQLIGMSSIAQFLY